MTCREAYRLGRELLSDMEEGAWDAGLLFEEAYHLPPTAVYTDPMREMPPEETEVYLSALNRRKDREPLAYIIGHWGFMGLDFLVNEDVLIPEQDSECLAEHVLELAEENPFTAVLDIGTGSGCLLLSFLHERRRLGRDLPAAWGIDISAGALAVARANADRLGLSEEVTFAEGDLFPDTGIRFDLILSNPPYIAPKERDTLAPEVLREPALALFGGEDGLSFYRRIAAGAPDHMLPGGRLVLEIGWDQAEAVTALLAQNGFGEIRLLQDLGGRDRVLSARLL